MMNGIGMVADDLVGVYGCKLPAFSTSIDVLIIREDDPLVGKVYFDRFGGGVGAKDDMHPVFVVGGANVSKGVTLGIGDSFDLSPTGVAM